MNILCDENTQPVSCEVNDLIPPQFRDHTTRRMLVVDVGGLYTSYPVYFELTHPSTFVPVLLGRHRFVSLLPFQRRPSIGEQRAQSWTSPHAFLSAGRGDASDHALLLCSFLLGFGLDAFVCVGQVHSFDNAEREKGVPARQGLGAGIHRDEAKREEETGHMVSVW